MKLTDRKTRCSNLIHSADPKQRNRRSSRSRETSVVTSLKPEVFLVRMCRSVCREKEESQEVNIAGWIHLAVWGSAAAGLEEAT